mmetsp:Transcript_25205/g.57985  ORF Transcript_25205/g.57985 Transcript_25205/m.57985 type:complete len:1376 (-) Transcript_25205:99-4226(-)
MEAEEIEEDINPEEEDEEDATFQGDICLLEVDPGQVASTQALSAVVESGKCSADVGVAPELEVQEVDALHGEDEESHASEEHLACFGECSHPEEAQEIESLLQALCRVPNSRRLIAIDDALGVLIETGLGAPFCDEFTAAFGPPEADENPTLDSFSSGGNVPAPELRAGRTRPSPFRSQMVEVQQAKEKLLKDSAEARTLQADALTLASARDLTQAQADTWQALPSMQMAQLDPLKDTFYSKLGHKMRCWQAIHGEFLPAVGPVARKERSKQSGGFALGSQHRPEPLPQQPSSPPGAAPASRGRPLYGLTKHLEVQQKRRIRRLHQETRPGLTSPGPPWSPRAAGEASAASWYRHHSIDTTVTGNNVATPASFLPRSMHMMPLPLNSDVIPEAQHEQRFLQEMRSETQRRSWDQRSTPRAMVSPLVHPLQGRPPLLSGMQVDDDEEAGIAANRFQAQDAAPGIALRRRQTYVAPHKHLSVEEVCFTAEFSYVRKCQLGVRVPRPSVWYYFGRGGGLVDASSASLQDADACTVIETAVERAASGEPLSAIDLSQNRLTDVGLSRVCQLMQGPPLVCGKLTYLNLSFNTALRLRRTGLLEALIWALQALPLLAHLDLSGTPVNGHVACSLASALRTRSQLRVLALASCNLGVVDQADCVAVASLIRPATDEGQATLHVADLSHNSFGCAGFAAVASALKGSQLRSLSFAGNSCTGATDSHHPMQLLIEGLLFNASLQSLNLSGCGLGPAEAFMLEDALQEHCAIRIVDLSNNPLGGYGLRSVIRMSLAMYSELEVLDVTGHREALNSQEWVQYRWTHPGGVYNLNLSYPRDRAVMRTLLRKSREIKVYGRAAGPLQFFKFDPKLLRPTIEWSSQHKTWIVPTQGIYCFTFLPVLSELGRRYSNTRISISESASGGEAIPPPAIARLMSNADDGGHNKARGCDPQRGSELARHEVKFRPPAVPDLKLEANWGEVGQLMSAARLRVSSSRFPQIRAMINSMDNLDQASRILLACTKDFSFEHDQILALCSDQPEMVPQIVAALLPSVLSKTDQLRLMLKQMVGNRSPTALQKVWRHSIWLNVKALSGSYHLDLEVPADCAVADTILLVNSWESEVARIIGLPDTSQQGNNEMLRNVTLDKVPMRYKGEWRWPDRGVLDFDFSSVQRPARDSIQTEADVVAELSRCLMDESFSCDAKLQAMVAVSEHLCITSTQFHTMAKCLPQGPPRRILFVQLHIRVVDRPRLLSMEVLHNPAIFTAEDRCILLVKVGYLHLLNPLHPEGVTYTCNLAVYEERVVIEFLVQLTLKEPSSKVIDVTIGPRPWGLFAAHKDDKTMLPASWADKGVPTDDALLACYYETTTANTQWRQALAEKFCAGQFNY